MRANKGKDTKPELSLRRIVHAKGLRYRVNHRPLSDLRRTADLVFTRAKVAVFVDGCYWHGCPQHHRPSNANRGFWSKKIDTNRARDQDTNRRLDEAGWRVIRIWEHEDVELAAERIVEAARQHEQPNRGDGPRRS
jgi:DNA mismatch endonuclease (patch repair protein)